MTLPESARPLVESESLGQLVALNPDGRPVVVHGPRTVVDGGAPEPVHLLRVTVGGIGPWTA
jgi:hypothetical protein